MAQRRDVLGQVALLVELDGAQLGGHVGLHHCLHQALQLAQGCLQLLQRSLGEGPGQVVALDQAVREGHLGGQPCQLQAWLAGQQAVDQVG